MRLSYLALATALVLTGFGMAQTAHADDAASVHVKQAWIRVLPGALPNAGYATLENSTDHAIKLVSAESAAYGKVMLHQSTESGGISRMHAVQSLSIPAHGQVKLAPGGYHLMLMHAVQPVSPGNQVRITLHFADGSTQQVNFMARPANATGPGG